MITTHSVAMVWESRQCRWRSSHSRCCERLFKAPARCILMDQNCFIGVLVAFLFLLLPLKLEWDVRCCSICCSYQRVNRKFLRVMAGIWHPKRWGATHQHLRVSEDLTCGNICVYLVADGYADHGGSCSGSICDRICGQVWLLLHRSLAMKEWSELWRLLRSTVSMTCAVIRWWCKC